MIFNCLKLYKYIILWISFKNLAISFPEIRLFGSLPKFISIHYEFKKEYVKISFLSNLLLAEDFFILQLLFGVNKLRI